MPAARGLADSDHCELSVGTVRGRELVERRQLLDARRTPRRPQVHQHWNAPELSQANRRAVGGCEAGRGRAGPLMAAIDALVRSGFGGWRGLVRWLLLSGLVAGGEDERCDANDDEAHAAPLAEADTVG